MVSLTPHERNAEVSAEANREGLLNGLLTLIPCSGAVYMASQYPSFRTRTNIQARTAMAIMPALFMYAFTSEHKLSHRMHEVANEAQHSQDTVQWAEQQVLRGTNQSQFALDYKANDRGTQRQLDELYHQSVRESGVCIVPGDTLALHHQVANFTAEHPIKVLAAVATPAVAYIFYGRTGQDHLQLSSKIMHTRVFGQFAVLTLLLSVMGFKEYMEQHGKFITEAQAQARVQEMHRIRTEWQSRLQRQRATLDEARRELAAAQAEVAEQRAARQNQQ